MEKYYFLSETELNKLFTQIELGEEVNPTPISNNPIGYLFNGKYYDISEKFIISDGFQNGYITFVYTSPQPVLGFEDLDINKLRSTPSNAEFRRILYNWIKERR
jgi:hypothetical protein